MQNNNTISLVRIANYFSNFLFPCDGARSTRLLSFSAILLCLTILPLTSTSKEVSPPKESSAPATETTLTDKAEEKDSIESYNKLFLEQPDQPAEFFYNWGTLHLKEKKNAEAFMALQKSVFLQPWSRSSWNQLALAKENLSPDLMEYRPDHWYSWWPTALHAFSWRWLLAATLIASAIYFGLSIKSGFRNSSLKSGALFACGLFFLLFFFSYLQQLTPAAIVTIMGPSRAGPATSFPEVRRLPLGAMLSLEEQRESWCKVRHRNPEAKSEVSWLECASLLRL